MRLENDYDAFAQAYVEHNEDNAWNAYYERPALLAMVGDVQGLDILDAGCGGGALAAALLDRGAHLTALDSSAAMLRLARGRTGSRATYVLADLQRQLPFCDSSFDRVVSSLVLHYLSCWDTVLSECHRVLRPGGRLVFSVHHPFMDHIPTQCYFDTYAIHEAWTIAGTSVRMKFWHRPLDAIFRALKDAGFSVYELREPGPEPAASERFPDAFDVLRTKPRFLFLHVQRL